MVRKILTCFFIIFFISCSTNKRYEDYKEEDFVEKQGVIIKTKRTSDPFDDAWDIDIEYAYNFDDVEIKYGIEPDIDLMFKIGQPIIILVHKENSNVNFYARRGIINEKSLREGYKRLNLFKK